MFITMKELKMHDTRGFKDMMRIGPEQFDQILQEIEPHICKKCTKMGVVVWLDFRQLRVTPPSCLPILNHVNSWRYVIGLRSRRVFFPYATLLKPWPNYPTFVGRTYLLDNMFDGNRTSSNIWLSKNCSMIGYMTNSRTMLDPTMLYQLIQQCSIVWPGLKPYVYCKCMCYNPFEKKLGTLHADAGEHVSAA